MHADYGGVVPELASRDHVRKLLPLIRERCAKAGLPLATCAASPIRQGPGLVGALLVGASCARALAWSLDVPAHRRASHGRASAGAAAGGRSARTPFVALLVSGGHSMLIEVAAVGHYRCSATRSTTPPAKPSTRPPR